MGITSDTSDLIAALQAADSPDSLLAATRALATCGDPAAAQALVEVLGFNNPGAAVAAVEGLILLGSDAVPSLLRLDPQNYGARAWAVRALAGIGDVRGLELLEEALSSDVAASVRRAAARGLGQLNLSTLERSPRLAHQDRCLRALVAARGDAEWVVRYAVAMGLESLGRQLTVEQPGLQQLREALEALARPDHESIAVVRLRATVALSRLDA
jgi:phycocyanobilin lyase beta subunit